MIREPHVRHLTPYQSRNEGISSCATPQPIIWLRTADQPGLSVDAIVRLWLTAKSGSSAHTRRTYGDQMKWYRAWLLDRSLDLDSYDTLRLAAEVQAWASRDNPARSTYNHRLGVISSFYQYARRHQLLVCDNPTAFIDRIVAPPYSNVRTLDFTEVRRCLAAIDRSTVHGKRDFAFLVIALTTGRRRAELMRLRMGDLEIHGENITLIWRQCKGGKVARDTLADFPRRVLLEYLHALYGQDLAGVAKDAAVWASIARHNHGQPLHSTSMYRICLENLGITSVHLLRHTFAHAMEEAGAKVSDIQDKLGHSNLATTSIYLAALRRPENPYADAIAALFGVPEIIAEGSTAAEKNCEWCGQIFDLFAQSDRHRRYCSRTCSEAARRVKDQAVQQQIRQESIKTEDAVPVGHKSDPEKLCELPLPPDLGNTIITSPEHTCLVQLPLWGE